MPVIDKVPNDFIDRINSPDDEYYPAGVDEHTIVETIIEYNGKLYLNSGSAQSFGWTKKPTPSSIPGVISESAAITHYKIIVGVE